MVDTCQAASLYEKFTSPNVLAVASSLVGEDSLSVSLWKKVIFFIFDLQPSAPCGSIDWSLHDRPVHLLRLGVPGEGAAL